MSAFAKAKALAGGAISYISGLIRTGTHPFAIINKIRSAYRGLNMGEVSEVYWTAQGATAAAFEAGQISPTESVPIGDIPINPNAIPALQQPNQFKSQIIGQFAVPGQSQTFYRTVNVYTLGAPSRAQLELEWQNWFISMVGSGTYPGAVGIIGGAEDLGLQEIKFIERGF